MTKNSAGENVAVAIPKNSDVTIHIAGLHYNRTYIAQKKKPRFVDKFFFYQLVTGTIRTPSTRLASWAIGLETPSSRSAEEHALVSVAGAYNQSRIPPAALITIQF